MGTFLTYRLAGGEAGMRHFLAQFGPALKLPWTKLVACELTDELTDRVAAQSDDQAGGIGLREYEQKRDDCLVDVMTALRANAFGAGATLGTYAAQLAARQDAAAAPADAAANAADGPPVLLTTRVDASWIDYNGHMTEWAYLKVFGDTTDMLLARIGAGADYVAGGHSFYTVESHLRHLGQARLGEALRVTTQVLGADAKRLHVFHAMSGPDGGMIATAEHMLVHVDAAAERSAPMLPAVAAAVADLAQAQAGLPRPSAAGRSIALPS
jgi:carnitine 3-dehydrogenase